MILVLTIVLTIGLVCVGAALLTWLVVTFEDKDPYIGYHTPAEEAKALKEQAARASRRIPWLIAGAIASFLLLIPVIVGGSFIQASLACDELGGDFRSWGYGSGWECLYDEVPSIPMDQNLRIEVDG